MSTISVTQLYEQLTEGVGKETAENLCSYIDGKIKEELEDQTKILATKKDAADLRLDIESLRLATKTDIDSLRQDTKKDIADLRLDIESLRLATKTDIDSLRQDTKKDIADLRLDIESLRLATKTDIDSLRQSTKKDTTDLRLDIESIRTEMKVYTAETKAEIMRWMFIFWVGQVAVIFGLLLAFLKK